MSKHPPLTPLVNIPEDLQNCQSSFAPIRIQQLLSHGQTMIRNLEWKMQSCISKRIPTLDDPPLSSLGWRHQSGRGGKFPEPASLSNQVAQGPWAGSHPWEIAKAIRHCYCCLVEGPKLRPTRKEEDQTSKILCALKLTLISFTCLLSGGETPYKNAATWVRRSAAVMNARRIFLGRTYVNEPASSLTSSFETYICWRRRGRCVAEIARTRQSDLLLKTCCS